MPLIDPNQPVSPSMQRWFGASLGCLIAIVCLPFGMQASIIGLLVGLVIAAIYYSLPATQLPVIRLWQRLTSPIAFVVGHLLFGAIYFLLLTPLGLVLRFSGRDPLSLRTDENTNWKPRNTKDVSSERYFRQY